jgi:hypothetical protein
MGDRETNWSRDVLERIVVLLFALAGLADLAAGASFHRRRRVLGILSHGEVEARAFGIQVATGAPVQADALESACEATCLAVRLRALAMVLIVLLTQAGQFTLPRRVGPRAGRHKPIAPTSRRAAASAPDTS